MEDKIKTIVIDGVEFTFSEDKAFEKDGHVYCRKCKEKIDSDPLNCLGNKKILFRRQCKCDREEESLRKEKEEADHIRRLREECFITSRNLINCTFDRVIAPDRQEVIIAKNFVKNFKELSKDNNGLIFHGNVGTGKTYLAACIANKIIEDYQIRVKMRNIPQIINDIDKERIYSRLREMCIPVKIAGKDIRTELGRKKLRETRDLLLGDR